MTFNSRPVWDWVGSLDRSSDRCKGRNHDLFIILSNRSRFAPFPVLLQLTPAKPLPGGVTLPLHKIPCRIIYIAVCIVDVEIYYHMMIRNISILKYKI